MLKARVVRRKKGQDLTAKQPQGELPTLAQALQMREMEVANAQGTTAAMVGADNSPSQVRMETAQMTQPSEMETARSSRMTVKRKKAKEQEGADVYDLRIGGYGQSMGPQESGEQAVQRIMKVKRKGK